MPKRSSCVKSNVGLEDDASSTGTSEVSMPIRTRRARSAAARPCFSPSSRNPPITPGTSRLLCTTYTGPLAAEASARTPSGPERVFPARSVVKDWISTIASGERSPIAVRASSNVEGGRNRTAARPEKRGASASASRRPRMPEEVLSLTTSISFAPGWNESAVSRVFRTSCFSTTPVIFPRPLSMYRR